MQLKSEYYCYHCGYYFGEQYPGDNIKCPKCKRTLNDVRERYYYCYHCGYRFGEQYPGDNIKCPNPNCPTNAGVPPPPNDSSRDSGSDDNIRQLILLFLYLLGIVVLCAVISAMIFAASAEIVLWLEFLVSILLSILVLGGATLLILSLLIGLIYLIASIFSFSIGNQTPASDLTGHSINDYGGLIGTLTNLVASLGALLIVSWIFQRPLDYWDFGIQFLIALIIEFKMRQWAKKLLE